MSCDIGKVTEGLENALGTYVTAHSPILPSLHLRHSTFSNPSVALSTSQLILQPFRRFICVTAHSPTLPSLCIRHSSFSNPSVALPTWQLIPQHFRRFIYAIVHSPTLLSLLLRHKLFTYVTWRAATAVYKRSSAYTVMLQLKDKNNAALVIFNIFKIYLV